MRNREKRRATQKARAAPGADRTRKDRGAQNRTEMPLGSGFHQSARIPLAQEDRGRRGGVTNGGLTYKIN